MIPSDFTQNVIYHRYSSSNFLSTLFFGVDVAAIILLTAQFRRISTAVGHYRDDISTHTVAVAKRAPASWFQSAREHFLTRKKITDRPVKSKMF
jgi:hypothetical protein